jgi:hypothetical protein
MYICIMGTSVIQVVECNCTVLLACSGGTLESNGNRCL